MKKNLKNFLFLAALFLLAFFEANFLFHFRFWPRTPVILILFVFLPVFFGSGKSGVFWAGLAGIFLDLASSGNFGIFFLTLAMDGFLIKKISSFFKKADYFVFAFLLILFFVFYRALFYFWNFVFNLLF